MADTRSSILDAGLRLFGEKGFEAVGIREIAAAAGCNVASISYHFGGKEGLRDACAGHVVEIMGRTLGGDAPPADGVGDAPPADGLDGAAAEAVLAGMVRRLARFLLREPDGRLVAGFMLREVGQPSRALDIIYDGLLVRIHGEACRLWAAASGGARPPESAAVRLAVFAVIGQILYFHLARPLVLRRMGWAEIGDREAEAIAGTVVANVEARLAADRGAGR